MRNFFKRKKVSQQLPEEATEAAVHLNAISSRNLSPAAPEENKPERILGHDFSKIRIYDNVQSTGKIRGLNTKSFFATRE